MTSLDWEFLTVVDKVSSSTSSLRSKIAVDSASRCEKLVIGRVQVAGVKAHICAPVACNLCALTCRPDERLGITLNIFKLPGQYIVAFFC